MEIRISPNVVSQTNLINGYNINLRYYVNTANGNYSV